jgi:hypothetical protein
MIGPAIQTHECLAEYGERDHHLVAGFTNWVIGQGRMCWIDMAIWKSGRVKLGRSMRLTVVEPQAGDQLTHGRSPYCIAAGQMSAGCKILPNGLPWLSHAPGVPRPDVSQTLLAG